MTRGGKVQDWQMPEMGLTMKKGSQQMMKTPITIPSVVAAFCSLANLFSFLQTVGLALVLLLPFLPGDVMSSDSVEGSFSSLLPPPPPPPLDQRLFWYFSSNLELQDSIHTCVF